MASEPTSVTPPRGNRKFEFFELPRELRDKIYELLWLAEKTDLRDGDFSAYLETRIPIPKLCLVSERFATEYDESFATNNLVKIVDMSNGCSSIASARVPHLAKPSREFELVLAVMGCRFRDINPHDPQSCYEAGGLCRKLHWCTNVLDQMPKLCKTHIKIITKAHRCVKGLVAQAMNFPELAGLEVHSSLPALSKLERPLVVWTRRQGMVFERSAVEIEARVVVGRGAKEAAAKALQAAQAKDAIEDGGGEEYEDGGEDGDGGRRSG